MPGAVMRRAGFSLLETLLAVVILSGGLVGIVQAITASLRSGKEAERLTSAALLAVGHLEVLRAEPWIEAGEDEGDFGETAPLYAWAERIEPAGAEGLYDVSIAIRLRATDETVFVLETRLFDPPAGSLSEEDGRDAGAGRAARGGRRGERRAP